MNRRRITSSDVAKHAGVSRTTVSFVLNGVTTANISEETRERVLAAATELGYVPDAAAQALARGRAQTVGIVFTRPEPLPDGGFMRYHIVEGLMAVARQHGMGVLVDSVPPAEVADTYRQLARTRRIDGLIVSDTRVNDRALRELIHDGFPIIVLGLLPHLKVSTLEFDNRGGARQAVKHLIDQGHRRIGVILYAPREFTGAAERLLGYQDALAAAGIPFDEALVRYGNYSPSSGYNAALSLLEKAEPPTAIFVASDEVAIGALAAIHAQGLRVPEQMAIVGFDDNPLARFTTPALTTVRLPFEEMGRQAARMLIERILDPGAPLRQVLLPTELLVRASSRR